MDNYLLDKVFELSDGVARVQASQEETNRKIDNLNVKVDRILELTEDHSDRISSLEFFRKIGVWIWSAGGIVLGYLADNLIGFLFSGHQ